MTGIPSLLASGSRLWLDGIDPDAIAHYAPLGISGATSNPIIIADLVKTGRYDARLGGLMRAGGSGDEVAWRLTDELVSEAQGVFRPVWERTAGDDGYVSFELDPLIEDPQADLPHAQRVERYVELGRRWSLGYENRLIKVPATPAGLEALPILAAEGVNLNVTLMFTQRQYQAAREAIWSGARRRASRAGFKSVYSIFISRVDVYTGRQAPLSPAAQGQVGLVIAKRVWLANRRFWSDKGLGLRQEIVFASTGVKRPGDPPDRYVAALAGSDIQTNPPETTRFIETGGQAYPRTIEQMPSAAVLAEIDQKVDMDRLEADLLAEGVEKFVKPQRALLELIARKRPAPAEAG